MNFALPFSPLCLPLVSLGLLELLAAPPTFLCLHGCAVAPSSFPYLMAPSVLRNLGSSVFFQENLKDYWNTTKDLLE